MEPQETTPDAETEATEDRPLNRAERRAQQHKKKGAATPGLTGAPHGVSSPGGAGARTGGAGQVRLPRTGHK